MIHLDEQTLIDYTHGALEPQADADVFTHLAGCSPCAQAHNDEIALIEILRSKAIAEEREFPSNLRTSILAATAAAPAPSLGGILRNALANFRTRAAFGTAAGMAAVAALVVFVPHTMNPPSTAPIVAKVPSAAVHITAAAFIARHDAATSDLPLSDHFSAPAIETASYSADDADSAMSPE